MDNEIRMFKINEMRVKTGDGSEPAKIVGYAAVYNTLSENLGGFREKIRAGAFSKTIEQGDVRALFNHDSNLVLGRTKSGTLKLSEDETGLKIEIDPPDTQYAKDLMTSIQRGDVDQMSFGFTTIKDEWDQSTEPVTRTLVEVDLFDVSPVTFPAYPQTSVDVREMAKRLTADRSEGGPKADLQQLQARLDVLRRVSEIQKLEIGGK